MLKRLNVLRSYTLYPPIFATFIFRYIMPLRFGEILSSFVSAAQNATEKFLYNWISLSSIFSISLLCTFLKRLQRTWETAGSSNQKKRNIVIKKILHTYICSFTYFRHSYFNKIPKFKSLKFYSRVTKK